MRIHPHPHPKRPFFGSRACGRAGADPTFSYRPFPSRPSSAFLRLHARSVRTNVACMHAARSAQ